MGGAGKSGLAFVHEQTHNPLPMTPTSSSPRQSKMPGDQPDLPRAVLITGASGGIGRAMSLAFAQAGWFVGVHYHRNKNGAEETLRQIEGAGAAGTIFQADIRELRAVQLMVDTYMRQAPAATAFICNAGIAASQLLVRQPEVEWTNVITTNLTGTFHCLRAMGPPLIAQGGGSIIVIGSHAGFHGSIGQAAYAASKAGLIGLVKTAAQEWGPQNVRVNLVLPGWQKTGLSEGAMPETGGWADHALGKPPSREEVAQTVLHLAQQHGMSGQVWNCDSRFL